MVDLGSIGYGPSHAERIARSVRIMVAQSLHTTCHEGSVLGEDRQGRSQRHGASDERGQPGIESPRSLPQRLQFAASAIGALMQETKGVLVAVSRADASSA
ncbi:TPA: hypothetical protein ACH3X1_002410 [Trebouxia sp. C0004]